MAYSYARRKELAALKLRALGIDARGRNPEKAWREATAELRQQATTAYARQAPTYKGGGVHRPGRTVEQVRQRVQGIGGKRVPQRQAVPALGAEVTTSSSQRTIAKALRDAKAAGKRVVIYATIDKGQGPRTRVIDGRGAQGEQLSGGAAEGRGAGLSGETDASIVGKLQIVAAPIGSPAFGGSSIDPGDLLDYLSAYDDWWDAWSDLADSDYS